MGKLCNAKIRGAAAVQGLQPPGFMVYCLQGILLSVALWLSKSNSEGFTENGQASRNTASTSTKPCGKVGTSITTASLVASDRVQDRPLASRAHKTPLC